jgi:hypothetical protein
VLPFAAGRASALFGQPVALLQFCDFFFKIHSARIIAVGMVWQMGGGSQRFESRSTAAWGSRHGTIVHARAYISIRLGNCL